MENKESRVFTLTGEDGREVEYEVIFTFTSEAGKDYVVYTDRKRPENGKLRVLASTFNAEDDTVLDPVESDQEWDMIWSMLQEMIHGKDQ